jgi:hypothetical protein
MSVSPIKRMQRAKIATYKRLGVRTYIHRNEWDTPGGRRWKWEGTVTMPRGLVVDVWSGGLLRDPSDGLTILGMTFKSRRHHYSDRHPIDSKISLRRLAVAFANRVTGGAS